MVVAGLKTVWAEKVWIPVQVLALATFRLGTTAPVVGEMVKEPSLLLTDATAAVAVVAKVPEVGNVTEVLPVRVPAKLYAPRKVSEPPRDTASPPILATVIAPALVSVASPDMATKAGSFPEPWSTNKAPEVPMVAKPTLLVPSPSNTAWAVK